jgi:uncharacterized protein with gpF-like domain
LPKSKTSLDQLLYEIRRIEESREVLTEDKIKAMYRTLNDELSAFIAKKYTQYADGDGRLYIAYLDAQNQRARFLREIAKNVDTMTPQVQEEIMQLVNDTYKTSYKGMAEAFAKAEKAGKFAEAVKDIATNPNVLRQAVNNNISKLTLSPVLEKHRNEIIYQIQQELNIGLMQGDRYETMAKRISERVGVSYSKAMNIARTESHRNVESGFMDCAENLQSKMKGNSNLIYAVTWRTMKDERVRPNQRRKTKHGWKIVKGKGSANHQQMEGVTIKVGELFDLGNGIKTKAPGQSGDAANDCRCRCFLEYNLMTVEEFAKATGKSEATIRKKYITTTDKENNYKQFYDGETINQFFYYDNYANANNILAKQRSQYAQWKKKLSQDESDAIYSYAAGGYVDINSYLRNRSGATKGWTAERKNRVEKRIKQLDDAIATFDLKDNILVQRGASQESLDILFENSGGIDELAELVGSKYHDDGFMSTTVLSGNRVATTKPVVFYISIPAGKGRGAYINDFGEDFKNTEYEFLIRRGADFTITGITEDDELGKTYVKMLMNVK